MQGKRVEYPGPYTLDHHQPGNYWVDDQGHWYGVSPNGLLVGLTKHQVEEHEDGTISVTQFPIFVQGGPGDTIWHGYLNHGVWEEC